MRFIEVVFIVVLLISIKSFLVHKADGAESLPETRIETDQVTGTIRFIVKGKEAALINAEGLQVRDGIKYAGTLTDAGTSHFVRNKVDAGDANAQ